MWVLRTAAVPFRVGMLEAQEGPLGYGVRDGARDVQGREGVEALDAAAGRVAYACDAGTVAGAVRVVDILDYRLAHRFSCQTDAAGRFDARDGCDEARAGDPEARRHLSRTLGRPNGQRAAT